jgi:hypothetical protein
MAVDVDREYIGVTAITGEEGTGKSTMALTFPKPLYHFEIDFGGFDRAVWFLKASYPDIRIKKFEEGEDIRQVDLTQYDVISKPYPKPLQVNKLLGQLGGGPSTRQLKQPKKVEGMKELWQTIVSDFVYVCGVKEILTVVFDSSTALWNIAHNTRLQELQEIQEYKWKKEHPNTPFPEDEYRERLQPIEYGPANDRMTSVLQTSRSFKKDLVLTHYPTDEYGTVPDGKGGVTEGKTGKLVIDGFKHTGKNSDLILWLVLKEYHKEGKVVRQPAAKITKCGVAGMGLNAIGMEISANYDSFASLRNLMRGSTSGNA